MVLNHFTAPIVTSVEAPKAQLQSQEHKPGPKAKGQVPAERTDPNVPDHRLNINRPCIYERRLPGNAYITAHVQRLQHGYYSTPAVSDRDIDHVDFLAVSFVFHSPDTRNHRFRAATIRASLHYPSSSHRSSDPKPRHHRLYQNHPRFLMHAPHFLHGSLSPESLQWNYSLAGSLGIAQLPIIASLSPAAGLNGQFNRYEMMRIQGSVRSMDGVPASQIVWTLEENTLQRSGLPREFTFAMLVAKPGPESRVQFVLEVEPVLQSWFGAYPEWWITLAKRYRATRRKRGVDFRVSVGQRFGEGTFRTMASRRGFNFARLGAGFEEYTSFPWAGNMAMNAVKPQDQADSPDPSLPSNQDPDYPHAHPPMPMPMPVPVPMPMPVPGQDDGVPAMWPMPIPVPMPGGQERNIGHEPEHRHRHGNGHPHGHGPWQGQYKPQSQSQPLPQTQSPSARRGRDDTRVYSSAAYSNVHVPRRTSSKQPHARSRSRSQHGYRRGYDAR